MEIEEMNKMIEFLDVKDEIILEIAKHADAIYTAMEKNGYDKGYVEPEDISNVHISTEYSTKRIVFYDSEEEEENIMPFEVFIIPDVDTACKAWIRIIENQKISALRLSDEDEIALAKRIFEKHGLTN